MPRKTSVVVVVGCLFLLPAAARAACPTDRADRLFAHPYGEPATCSDEPETRAAESFEHEPLEADPRGDGSHALRSLGIAGMGGGAGLLGLGGTMYLGSLLFSQGSSMRGLLHDVGIGVAIVGGIAFIGGAGLVGVDALLTPAPTPDRKGAQLVLAFSF